MIRLRRPTEVEIALLLAAPTLAFSYPEVGATSSSHLFEALPSTYVIDRRRFALGTGRMLFEQARAALLAWRHFEIPWLELHGAGQSVHEGQVVATSTRAFGVWFVNPCRVVYSEAGNAESDQLAFAYGTLAGHVEAGEERFEVHHDRETDEVWFEILAFSRPAVLLTRLGHSWVRRIQRRFAGSSAEALARACGRGGEVRELRQNP
jgi:uncharacterized protein (UPF0548 family)